MRHFKHLTYTDRLNIEKWLREGMKKGEITDRLRVHRNTITNELKRGRYTHLNSDYTTEERYSPDIADMKYRDHLKAKGPGYKIGNDIAFANFLEDKMLGVQEDGTVDKQKRYSPAAALAAARAEGFETSICAATLYSYITKGDVFFSLTNKDLHRKGDKKQKHRKVKAAKAPRGESIERRPEEVNERIEPFHWEMDSVIGKRGTKECLVTLTERKSRQELAFKVKDHTAQSVVEVLDRLERKLGSRTFRRVFRSITVDNGTEFSDCIRMEASSITKRNRTKLYYCHPYSSWERGSNENQNRMIRRFYPKGTDFSKVRQKDIQGTIDWINKYPRLILGWHCSEELFAEQLITA